MIKCNIVSIDTKNMEFKGNIEEVWIPIVVGTEDRDILDGYIYIAYKHKVKSFHIESRNYFHSTQKQDLVNSFQTEAQFNQERMLVNEFIEKWSIERPISELKTIEMKETENADIIVVNFEGEGLGNGKHLPYMIFHKTPKDGKFFEWGDMNCSYLGFSDKVYEILREKHRLYFLMKHGE